MMDDTDMMGPISDTEPEQMSPNEEDEPLDDTRTKTIKLPEADSLFTETPHETGYHKSTRICLQYIREAMLHHRWKEASEYMSSYAQAMEDIAQGNVPPMMNEVYWRVGTEILHQHPNSMMEDKSSFYAQMKNVGVKGYLLISLEHAFHLLVNGQIMEAHQQLSIAECWRHGKVSQAQGQRIQLIQAYKGMLDYIIWCDRKSKLNTLLEESEDTETDPELHLYFRKASVGLMGILTSPGIWDPFILCYVDMLEFYSDLEGAEKVLTDYAYDSTFPSNPNACVYLYQYLKRHDCPEENQMKALKTLHTRVPSHELMLEYSTLLLQSDKDGCIQTALEVVLDMLDYACWKSSLDVWSHLKTTISRLKHQKGTEFVSVVSGVMATRKDWWPSYHFTSFHAQKDYAENIELMKVKSLLERKLCPGHSSYDATVRKINPDVSPQKKKQKRSKE